MLHIYPEPTRSSLEQNNIFSSRLDNVYCFDKMIWQKRATPFFEWWRQNNKYSHLHRLDIADYVDSMTWVHTTKQWLSHNVFLNTTYSYTLTHHSFMSSHIIYPESTRFSPEQNNPISATTLNSRPEKRSVDCVDTESEIANSLKGGVRWRHRTKNSSEFDEIV